MVPKPRSSSQRDPADKTGADFRRGAQTVHRALDILSVFSADRPSQSLAEISDAVGLTIPTTHRLLKALQGKEMVVWGPVLRRYSLGSGIMRLASIIINRDDLATIAQPGLEKLRSVTGETVGLHCMMGNRRVCLIELVSPHPIRMASGVGRSYPLYAGAAGKAMLAWTPPGTRDRAQAEVVEVRRLSLAKELEEIRQVGYAFSEGETTKGAAAVATAIRNSTDQVVGAINITGPADRFLSRRQKAVKPLLEVAGTIMHQLGRPEPRSAAGLGSR